VTLDKPNLNPALIDQRFGTSRGSFITSSITGNSGIKWPSEMFGPTTFEKSSDSIESVSEDTN